MLPILNAISAAAGPFSLLRRRGVRRQRQLSTRAHSPPGSTPFASLITDAIGQVNQLEDSARAAMTGLMTGTGVDVHQAMIATEKASMSFELALAVRNKAVQAYQQVMGMQF